mgnify:CR=1 FL=1
MSEIKRNGHGAMDMTQGSPTRLIVLFSLPLLAGNVLQQLYNMVDSVVVGNYVGSSALTAVGAGFSIMFLISSLFLGFSMGATIMIAQYVGAGDQGAVGRTVDTIYSALLVIIVPLTLLGVLASGPLLTLIRVPQEAYEQARTYCMVVLGGIVGTLGYNMNSGIMRGLGDSRTPLIFLFIACVINIVLDLVFVLVFSWGVFGVAIATVLSQVVSAVLIMVRLMLTRESYRVEIRKIRFDRGILRNVIRIGLPAGLQSVLYSVSNLVVQASINSFGTDAIASWAAIGKIDGFIWMVMSAFGIAITTFVGQNFGAQKYKRVRKSVRTCLLMALGTTVLMSTLFVFGMQTMLRLFTNDPAVLELGQVMTHYMCPFYFTYICIEVLSGAIRGTGVSLAPTIITCMGVCVLRVIWIMVLVPLRPELSTVLISYPLSWTLTSVIFMGYYLHGGWMRKRIMQLGLAPENEN